MSSIASFFSSFVSSVHADTEESKTAEPPLVQEKEEKTEPEEEKPEPEESEEEKPEPEEDEPEDEHPVIRDECKHSTCAALTKHFEHCEEKLHAGHGFKGEDCVEELCKSPFHLRILAFLIPMSTSRVNSPHDALCRQLRCTKIIYQAQVILEIWLGRRILPLLGEVRA